MFSLFFIQFSDFEQCSIKFNHWKVNTVFDSNIFLFAQTKQICHKNIKRTQGDSILEKFMKFFNPANCSVLSLYHNNAKTVI